MGGAPHACTGTRSVSTNIPCIVRIMMLQLFTIQVPTESSSFSLLVFRRTVKSRSLVFFEELFRDLGGSVYGKEPSQ